jgi:hypothetical protein
MGFGPPAFGCDWYVVLAQICFCAEWVLIADSYLGQGHEGLQFIFVTFRESRIWITQCCHDPRIEVSGYPTEASTTQAVGEVDGLNIWLQQTTQVRDHACMEVVASGWATRRCMIT